MKGLIVVQVIQLRDALPIQQDGPSSFMFLVPESPKAVHPRWVGARAYRSHPFRTVREDFR